jgi:Cyclic nucleotide-binding domain
VSQYCSLRAITKPSFRSSPTRKVLVADLRNFLTSLLTTCRYFLNSGAIEVFTKDGFSKILRRPGNFFGEGALLHPKKIRSASIRCVTPVHAIEISREYFEKYMQSTLLVVLYCGLQR